MNVFTSWTYLFLLLGVAINFSYIVFSTERIQSIPLFAEEKGFPLV